MLVDHTGSQQNHLRTPEEVLVSGSGFEMLQRFAAMIASSDDAIISNTIEGTVTSWNNGAERIFGYAAHEMLGQSISRLVSARGGDDMAKSLDRIRRGARRSLRSNAALQGWQRDSCLPDHFWLKRFFG